ncbi:alpha/beta hydrolase [Methylobacterium sp. Leaf466]|nr:alpha/beta hydrolase [Methylobacterium sp. Leaf466]
MPLMKSLGTVAAVCAVTLSLVVAAKAAAPPVQPIEGPGANGDRSATVVKRAVGRIGSASYVFHKAGPAPAEGRPVAIVLHAWGAPNPQVYGAWIDHLARKGFLVVFPRFQEVNRTRPADATANAIKAAKAAFAEIAQDGDAKPDLNRVAVLGHLAGAPIAATLAAEAAAEGLPVPKLVFVVMPGGIASDARSRGVPLKDLAALPAQTLIVTMIGDRDARAADLAARRILREATSVPPERKLFVRVLSDDHGFPALTATLASPAGVDAAFDGGAIKAPPEPPRDPKQPPPPFRWSADMALTGEQTTLVAQLNNARSDSLDYLAYWKTFDLAATAAFAGTDAATLKNNPRLSDMDRWADGWPVKRLVVEIPRLGPAPKPAPTPETVAAPRPAGRR